MASLRQSSVGKRTRCVLVGNIRRGGCAAYDLGGNPSRRCRTWSLPRDRSVRPLVISTSCARSSRRPTVTIVWRACCRDDPHYVCQRRSGSTTAAAQRLLVTQCAQVHAREHAALSSEFHWKRDVNADRARARLGARIDPVDPPREGRSASLRSRFRARTDRYLCDV